MQYYAQCIFHRYTPHFIGKSRLREQLLEVAGNQRGNTVPVQQMKLTCTGGGYELKPSCGEGEIGEKEGEKGEREI